MLARATGDPSSSRAMPMVALISLPLASADWARMPSLGKKMALPRAESMSSTAGLAALMDSFNFTACGSCAMAPPDNALGMEGEIYFNGRVLKAAEPAENRAHHARSHAEAGQLHVHVGGVPGKGRQVFAEPAEKHEEDGQPQYSGEQEQAAQTPVQQNRQARGQVPAQQGEGASDDAHHQGAEGQIVAALALVGGVQHVVDIGQIVTAPDRPAEEAENPDRQGFLENQIRKGDQGDEEAADPKHPGGAEIIGHAAPEGREGDGTQHGHGQGYGQVQ